MPCPGPGKPGPVLIRTSVSRDHRAAGLAPAARTSGVVSVGQIPSRALARGSDLSLITRARLSTVRASLTN